MTQMRNSQKRKKSPKALHGFVFVFEKKAQKDHLNLNFLKDVM